MSPERRQEERISLEVPVRMVNGSGLSRDISKSGIYFVTGEDLEAGRRIDFSLPLDYACPGRVLRLECKGEVLRVESIGEQRGVAARINECWCSNSVN